MKAWKDDYPWLQLAFKQIGPGATAASDGWRVRIEDELQTTLDFKVRPDGTATVWCGMSGYDFHHDPTPKELLEGLAEAYRRELKRLGGSYPTRTTTWKMSASARSSAQETADGDRSGPVTIALRSGPVEISRDACDVLLDEIRDRGGNDEVVPALEGSSAPVELDRVGRIVLFDAILGLAERAGGYEGIDPDLRLLQDRLKDEIAKNV